MEIEDRSEWSPSSREERALTHLLEDLSDARSPQQTCVDPIEKNVQQGDANDSVLRFVVVKVGE